MDTILAAVAAAASTVASALEVDRRVDEFKKRRQLRQLSPPELVGQRALIAAFFHIAGCNLAFSAMKEMLERYGIDRNEEALYLKDRREVLEGKDAERFDWYYKDLQRHTDRLSWEHCIAENVLKIEGQTRYDQQLERLTGIREALELIQAGGGRRTISYVMQLISVTFAETQQSIGQTLDIEVAVMPISLVTELDVVEPFDMAPTPTGPELVERATRPFTITDRIADIGGIEDSP